MGKGKKLGRGRSLTVGTKTSTTPSEDLGNSECRKFSTERKDVGQSMTHHNQEGLIRGFRRGKETEE